MKVKITNTLAKICAACAILAVLARVIIYFVIPKQVVRLYYPSDDMQDMIMQNYPMLAVSVLIAIVFIVACFFILQDTDGTKGFTIGMVSLVLYIVFVLVGNLCVILIPNMIATNQKQLAAMTMLDSTASRIQAFLYLILIASLCVMIGTYIKKIENVKYMHIAVAVLSVAAIVAEVLMLYVFPESLIKMAGFHIEYDAEVGRMILPESIIDILLAAIFVVTAIMVVKFFASDQNKSNDSIMVTIDYRKIYTVTLVMFVLDCAHSFLGQFINLIAVRMAAATKIGDEFLYYMGLQQGRAWIQGLVFPVIGYLIGISLGAIYRASK